MEAVILSGLQAAKLSGRARLQPCREASLPLVIPRDFSPEESVFQSFSVASGYRVPVNSPHILEAVILSGLQAAKDPYS